MAYIKAFNFYQTLKKICYKLYENLEWLLIYTSQWKDLFVNFISSLQVSTHWKDKTHNSILVIAISL